MMHRGFYKSCLNVYSQHLKCTYSSRLLYASTNLNTKDVSADTAKQTLQQTNNKLKTNNNNNFFKTVPFVKEDIQQIAQEVPDFKYYIFPNDQPNQNIYNQIPLDQPISQEREEKIKYDYTSPNLKFSKLENGLKIASIDKGGLTCFLSLCVHTGSRYETHDNFGVTHMIENMAFHSTAHLSWLRTIKTLETLGINAQCNIGREMILYSAEGLRETMPIVVPLLTGNILFPRFLDWEMKNNANRIEDVYTQLTKNVDAHITELLHTTAWQNNTLGNSLYAQKKDISKYNADILRQFMLNHFSPENMVFVGVNVDHDELCKWLMRSFIDYNTIPLQKRVVEKPKYTGGDCRVSGNSPLAHLAIAFETENGWNSEDLVATTLLQTYLGGGGSFSTGGPGKGMYTQLFLNVLNKNDWVESCMAFNTQYTDSGLFGIYITGNPFQGKAMANTLISEFKKMGNISKDELNRAKNSLKSSIWMNLELRPVIIEDIARQLLMSGHVKSAQEFCDMIDKITEIDIKKVATKLLKTRPTIVAYGDTSTIPHYDEICSLL